MRTPGANIVRRGSGIPLLFVHGNGVDHRLLLDLDDVFDQVGEWERIYLDLPGFGATPALSGRGGLPDLADWLDEVVESLIGPSPFAVVGSSMGGLLVRDLLSRRLGQCRGLALLATIVDPLHAHRTLPDSPVVIEDLDLVSSLDPDDAATYTEMAVVQSPENWERFRSAALPGIGAADEEAMGRIGEMYELPGFSDDLLKDFDQPVLVVAGKQDVVVGYEDQWTLSRSFTRSTYAALDLAGHNVHLDQPQIVRALLRDWIRQVVG